MQRVATGPGELDTSAPSWSVTALPPPSPDEAPVELPVPGPRVVSGWWGVLAAGVLGALVPQFWFRPGTFIAAGDVMPALRGLQGITRFWNTEAVGTGSTGYPSAQLLERGLLSGVRAIGGSPELAQRLWFTLVVAVCAASVAWLALALVRRPWAVFAAGAVAVLNPYHLTTVPNPLPMVAIASTAVVLGIIIRVASGRHVPVLLAVFLAAWAAQLARNPPLLALFLLVGALGFVVLMVDGPRLPALRLASALVLGSVFWSVPFALHHLLGTPGIHPITSADPNSLDFLQQHGGPANVVTLVASWMWGNADQLATTARLARFPWSLFRWALPVAVAVSLTFSWWRRSARVLLAAIIVLVVLGAGSNPPFHPVYAFLQDLIPRYDLFRQPFAKFGVLLVVCFALALALGVDDAQRRWAYRADAPEDAQTLPALGVLLACSVVCVNPLLLGTVIPGERSFLPSARVVLPASWLDAGAAIDALPGEGATLVFPLSDSYHRGTTWGFYGIDDLVTRVSERPAQSLLPDGYAAPDGASPALMREAESALANGDATALAGAMRALGAAYLAVRTDTTTTWGLGHEFRDGPFLLAAAERMGLQRVGTFEHVELFGVPGIDRFGSANREISLITDGRADADEVMAVAASVLDARTVIGTSGAPGTAWVPAPGNGGLAVSLPPGKYVSRVVSRGPALWRASVRDRTVSLVPVDRAEVDGVSLLDPTPVTLTANRAPFALLVANDPGDRARRLMVPLRGPTDVQLASGAEVSLLTLAPSILDLVRNPVQRCNAADGLPLGDPPPGSGVAASGSADSITFTAPRGSACIGESVRLPQPIDGHRRWLLTGSWESNQSGAARVCLWSSALAKCLPGSQIESRDTSGDFRQLIDTTDELGDVTLVLAADHVGPVTDPAITVSFTGVQLSPVQEADDPVSVSAPVGEAPLATVAGNDPLVIGVGNDVGSMLGSISYEVTDCDAFDDQPAEVTAEPLPSEPAPAVRLTANRHSACVAAPLATEPGVRDIVTSFEYQSSSATAARIALVDTVTGQVVASRRLPTTTFWSAQQVRWQLPPPPIGRDESLRLTLYAEGPRPGQPSQVVTTAYRNVRVSTATPFAFAVLPAPPDAASAAAEVRALDGRFVAVRSADDIVVTFRQAYSSHWSLEGLPAGATAEHLEVDGWANGWRVHGLDGRSVVLEAVFDHENLVSYAVWSVLVVWLAALLLTDWPRLFRRRAAASAPLADQ